jgi:hypothetical protein
VFFPGSRYSKQGTYQVTLTDGTIVTATRLPLPPPAASIAVLGWHRRTGAQRLDHIASHFLGDPTGFWKLCHANGAVVPDALTGHAMIAIPSEKK